MFGAKERQRCLWASLHDHMQAVRPSNPEVGFCVGATFATAGVVGHCHLIAHWLGDLMFERAVTAKPLRTEADIIAAGSLLGHCTLICREACGHSVIEGIIRATADLYFSTPTRTETLSNMLHRIVMTICESEEAQPYGACDGGFVGHGAGHGLVQVLRGPHGPKIGGLLGTLALCEAMPLRDTCEYGVVMEYGDETIRFAGKDLATVTATMARNDLACDNYTSSTVRQQCYESVGRAVGFNSCFDWDAAAAVCGNITSTDGRAACNAAFTQVTKFDAGVMTREAAEAKNFSTCVKHYSPHPSDAGKSVEQLVNQYFRVVSCTDANATRGCCGDGECEWMESDQNCPSDCASVSSPAPIAISGSFTEMQPVLEKDPRPAPTEGNRGRRCVSRAKKLPFCGAFVQYPIALSEAAALRRDKQVEEHFRAIRATIEGGSLGHEYDTGLPGEEGGQDGDQNSSEDANGQGNEDDQHRKRREAAAREPDDVFPINDSNAYVNEDGVLYTMEYGPDAYNDTYVAGGDPGDAEGAEDGESDQDDSDTLNRCGTSMQREFCLAAFPLCDGAETVPYCSVSRPAGYSAACGETVTCPKDNPFDVPPICGPSPDGGLVCTIEGGQNDYHDLFAGRADAELTYGSPACKSFTPQEPINQSEACAVARAAVCKTFAQAPVRYGATAPHRCFHRGIRPIAFRAYREVLYVPIDGAEPAVLWASKEQSGETEDRTPTRWYSHPNARVFVGPRFFVLLGAVVVVVAMLRRKQTGGYHRVPNGSHDCPTRS